MGVNTTHDNDPIDVWGGGAVAGLAAGVGMGVVMHFGANLIELLSGLVIPGTSAAIGWTMHMVLSVVFGLAFTVLVTRRAVRENVDTFSEFVLLGVAFGAVLGLFAGGVLFPVAMERAGVATLPLPFLPVPGVPGELAAAAVFALGHLVYGLLLGAVFAVINGVMPRAAGERAPAVGP